MADNEEIARLGITFSEYSAGERILCPGARRGRRGNRCHRVIGSVGAGVRVSVEVVDSPRDAAGQIVHVCRDCKTLVSLHFRTDCA